MYGVCVIYLVTNKMAYLWNKQKIIDTLLKFIPYSPIFIDLCTGGGSVWVWYKNKYNNELVVFNDIEQDQVYFLEWLLTLDRPVSESFLFDLWISREDFKFLLDWWENEYTKEYKRFRRFVLMNWSFGNNLKWYMYWRDVEPRKKSIHDTVLKIKYNKEWDSEMDNNAEVVYNSMTDVWKIMMTQEYFVNKLKELYNKELNNKNRNNYAIKNIYARICSGIMIPKLDKKQLRDPDFKKQYMENIHKLTKEKLLNNIEYLWVIQSLERLESLERLQSLETRMDFTSQSMFEFDFSKYPMEKTVVYLDPPYEDTHWYWTAPINYDYFRDWFDNHPYPMITSSYKARDYIRTYITLNKRKTISGNTLAKEWLYINKSFIEKYNLSCKSE